MGKLGPVVLAYGLGILAGNLSLLPEETKPLQEWLMLITIPLAIPLMLFSANLRRVIRLARGTLLSMASALVAVVTMVVSGYLIFHTEGQDELWKVGGMLTAVYSGGTPNLAAINLMLEVDPQTYVLTHTYDIILSTLYMFFLITIGQRVFLLFLPSFEYTEILEGVGSSEVSQGRLNQKSITEGSLALLLATAIIAVGGGISLLFSETYHMPVAILVITSLGIGASIIPQVNRWRSSFDLGMYLILIFSLAVASMADLTTLSGFAPPLFKYVSYVLFGSLLVHLLLSRLLKTDTDTMMVTSAALICSPPFVPVVAGAIGNKQVIVPGISVGIIGYAVGNYLGYLLAMLLKG